MQFLCLGYYDAERFEALNEAEQDAVERDSRPHDEALQACGHVRSLAMLEHRGSVSLRPGRGGCTLVSDGPFGGQEAAIGAFFIVEADCLEKAVRIASLHPAARLGEDLGFGVEVLPVQWHAMIAGL